MRIPRLGSVSGSFDSHHGFSLPSASDQFLALICKPSSLFRDCDDCSNLLGKSVLTSLRQIQDINITKNEKYRRQSTESKIVTINESRQILIHNTHLTLLFFAPWPRRKFLASGASVSLFTSSVIIPMLAKMFSRISSFVSDLLTWLSFYKPNNSSHLCHFN